MDEDLAVALRLQEDWDREAARREAARREAPSLVDASWELVDPTPDLRALFVQFDDRFFWGRLEAVEVKWSARMTLCAGICTYEGRGGMCSIRLSEPLLKPRPRRDLVETLLHEMIHAYLFVTNNDKDREGHGPEFCKHMHRINDLTGANITVYHTFHDEVEEYRQHWWRCNGPCQHRHPYYGYVKRATNRAPSACDFWWAEHQRTCGGTYIKIKEPENYSKKSRGKTKPGKRPLSAVGNKEKPSSKEAQPLIAFSGKGYVLGEACASPSSATLTTSYTVSDPQGPLSQDRSASALRPDSHMTVKWEPHLVSPIPRSSHQSVLNSYFPRVSVANQKAFRSVNGSPAKIKTIGDSPKPSASSGSQRRVPPRNVSRAIASASATGSHEGMGSEDQLPNKRSKRGDKTTSDTVFIKEQTQPDGSEPQTHSHNPSGQRQLVTCPVCQRIVVESQINSHLDQCLESVTKL